ncbi:MAG: hypothetical protein GY732_23925 [Gammaproteobacteria bacterium]|nr:hypothetical protein [Gammaproteobacteria bacterium]
MSCNASTLVRDLRNLNSGFRFRSIQLLDMFPATSHFETLIVLEMRQASR